MNFFTRNRVVTWILGGLLIITLSVLGSMIYHTRTTPAAVESRPGCTSSCQMLTGELDLDPAQNEQMEQILSHYRDSSSALVGELRTNRIALMEELRSDAPDSLQILRLSQEIGSIQVRMTRLAATQYLHIRSICTPDQQQQLSDLYCDLFGCPRIEQGGSQGKGQHRHRNGQK